jgi:phosphoglycolate phosphatase-like HAD superfamily hydrolase
MLPDRAPDLIIFDLDETLLDHRPVLRAAFTELFKGAAADIRQGRQEQFSQSLERFHNVVIAWDDFCNQLTEPFYSKSRGILSEAYGRNDKFPLYDGAAAFLKAMKNRGVSLYLVTRATPEFAQKALQENGIDSFFSQIHTRSEENKTSQYRKVFNHFSAPKPVAWIIGDSCDDLQCAIDLKNTNVYPIAYSDRSAAFLLPPRQLEGAKRYYINSYGEALKQLKM